MLANVNVSAKETYEKVLDFIRNQKSSLPTLPVVINNIIVTAKSDKTSAYDLADFIINDQAISTRILKIANSAYYGGQKKVNTISRAIVLIGFNEILSLILGMGVFSAFSKQKKNDLIDMTELWKHSIGVGFAAKKIGRRVGMIFNESTILVGLLHDIGKIIFAVYFPNEYRKVLKRAADEKFPLYKIEKDIFGLDHAEMAYLLMEYWNFPVDISQPVRYHHDQSRCLKGEVNMAYMVSLADFICHKSGIGQSGNRKLEEDHHLLGSLRLPYKVVDTLVNELKSERARVDSFLTALS